jgi:hypothetical protein
MEDLQDQFIEYMEGANESALFMKHQQLRYILRNMKQDDWQRPFTEWCCFYVAERIAEIDQANRFLDEHFLVMHVSN